MAVPTRAVVTFQTRDGVPRNYVKNDFIFANPVGDPAANLIQFFNNTATGATHPLAYYLSPFLSRAANATTVQLYNITNPLAGTGVSGPAYQTTLFTLAASGGSSLPQEIALVISLHAADSSIPEHGPGTRPKARYRGRVYIGPLSTAALDMDLTSNRCRPLSGTVSDFTKPPIQLLTQDPTWSVWSRKDRTLRPIVGGWVDDDYDVQRRRSTDPTSRTTWGSGL
jgi:hypothetical protein